jgi:putative transposase
MSRKKTDYSNDVKKKVVLEVLKEEETLNQIASKYKIIPRNIQKWRRDFIDKCGILFEKNKTQEEFNDFKLEKEKETEDLHRQIGELSVKLNWAQKKIKELGLEN